MSEQKIHVVDIEPTWEAILDGFQKGHFEIKSIKNILLPAIKIADVVRQAQKRGDKFITFNFPDKINVEVVENG